LGIFLARMGTIRRGEGKGQRGAVRQIVVKADE
jgi:hypothetical protein